MGDMGGAGPDKTSDVTNIMACAGCIAESEAMGRPDWEGWAGKGASVSVA